MVAASSMFSGIHEILLIAAIVLAVIFLPCISKPANMNPRQVRSRTAPAIALSSRQRLAILASLVWLAFWAGYYEPWGEEWKLFAYIGAGPVLVTWGLWWTLKGHRRI